MQNRGWPNWTVAVVAGFLGASEQLFFSVALVSVPGVAAHLLGAGDIWTATVMIVMTLVSHRIFRRAHKGMVARYVNGKLTFDQATKSDHIKLTFLSAILRSSLFILFPFLSEPFSILSIMVILPLVPLVLHGLYDFSGFIGIWKYIARRDRVSAGLSGFKQELIIGSFAAVLYSFITSSLLINSIAGLVLTLFFIAYYILKGMYYLRKAGRYKIEGVQCNLKNGFHQRPCSVLTRHLMSIYRHTGIKVRISRGKNHAGFDRIDEILKAKREGKTFEELDSNLQDVIQARLRNGFESEYSIINSYMFSYWADLLGLLIERGDSYDIVVEGNYPRHVLESVAEYVRDFTRYGLPEWLDDQSEVDEKITNLLGDRFEKITQLRKPQEKGFYEFVPVPKVKILSAILTVGILGIVLRAVQLILAAAMPELGAGPVVSFIAPIFVAAILHVLYNVAIAPVFGLVLGMAGSRKGGSVLTQAAVNEKLKSTQITGWRYRTAEINLEGKNALGTKFKKRDESISVLEHEARTMDELRERGLDVPVPLKSEEGSYVFTYDSALPHAPLSANIDDSHRYIAYQTEHAYFVYPENIETPEKMRQCAINSITQLAQMLKVGYIHTSLSPLTHEFGAERPWLWNFIPLGDVERLRTVLANSNIRLKGLADFAHARKIEPTDYLDFEIGQNFCEWAMTIAYHSSACGISEKETISILKDGFERYLRILGVEHDIFGEDLNNLTQFVKKFYLDLRVVNRAYATFRRKAYTLTYLIDFVNQMLDKTKESQIYSHLVQGTLRVDDIFENSIANAADITEEDNIIYAADSKMKCIVKMDLRTNSSEEIAKGSLSMPRAIAKEGDIIYVLDIVDGKCVIVKINLNNPESPEYIAIEESIDPKAMCKDGDFIYIADRKRGCIVKVDLNNPAYPEYIAEGILDSPRAMVKEGNIIYVADSGINKQCITKINLNNPGSPEYLAEGRVTYAEGMAKSGNVIYIANRGRDRNSVVIVDLETGSVKDSAKGVAPHATAMTGTGNTFYIADRNKRCLVKLTLPQEEELEPEILSGPPFGFVGRLLTGIIGWLSALTQVTTMPEEGGVKKRSRRRNPPDAGMMLLFIIAVLGVLAGPAVLQAAVDTVNTIGDSSLLDMLGVIFTGTILAAAAARRGKHISEEDVGRIKSTRQLAQIAEDFRLQTDIREKARERLNILLDRQRREDQEEEERGLANKYEKELQIDSLNAMKDGRYPASYYGLPHVQRSLERVWGRIYRILKATRLTPLIEENIRKSSERREKFHKAESEAVNLIFHLHDTSQIEALRALEGIVRTEKLFSVLSQEVESALEWAIEDLEKRNPSGAAMIPALSYLFEQRGWSLEYQADVEQVIAWLITLGLWLIPGIGAGSIAIVWPLFAFAHTKYFTYLSINLARMVTGHETLDMASLPHAPPIRFTSLVLGIATVNIIVQLPLLLIPTHVFIAVTLLVLGFIGSTVLHHKANLYLLTAKGITDAIRQIGDGYEEVVKGAKKFEVPLTREEQRKRRRSERKTRPRREAAPSRKIQEKPKVKKPKRRDIAMTVGALEAMVTDATDTEQCQYLLEELDELARSGAPKKKVKALRAKIVKLMGELGLTGEQQRWLGQLPRKAQQLMRPIFTEANSGNDDAARRMWHDASQEITSLSRRFTKRQQSALTQVTAMLEKGGAKKRFWKRKPPPGRGIALVEMTVVVAILAGALTFLLPKFAEFNGSPDAWLLLAKSGVWLGWAVAGTVIAAMVILVALTIRRYYKEKLQPVWTQSLEIFRDMARGAVLEPDMPEFTRGVELLEEVKTLAEKLGSLSEPFAALAKSKLLTNETKGELVALTRTVKALADTLALFANGYKNIITPAHLRVLTELSDALAKVVGKAGQLQYRLNSELLPEHTDENYMSDTSFTELTAIAGILNQLVKRLSGLLSREAPDQPLLRHIIQHDDLLKYINATASISIPDSVWETTSLLGDMPIDDVVEIIVRCLEDRSSSIPNLHYVGLDLFISISESALSLQAPSIIVGTLLIDALASDRVDKAIHNACLYDWDNRKVALANLEKIKRRARLQHAKPEQVVSAAPEDGWAPFTRGPFVGAIFNIAIPLALRLAVDRMHYYVFLMLLAGSVGWFIWRHRKNIEKPDNEYTESGRYLRTFFAPALASGTGLSMFAYYIRNVDNIADPYSILALVIYYLIAHLFINIIVRFLRVKLPENLRPGYATKMSEGDFEGEKQVAHIEIKDEFWKRMAAEDKSDLAYILATEREELYPEIRKRNIAGIEKIRMEIIPLGDPEDKKGSIVYLRLKNPVEIDGRNIAVLRIEGALPKVGPGNEIATYTGVRHLERTVIDDNGRNMYVVAVLPEERGPAGTMRYEDVMTKYGIMEDCRVDNSTDYAVGHVEYSHYRFKNKSVGCVIAGMEDDGDYRLGNHHQGLEDRQAARGLGIVPYSGDSKWVEGAGYSDERLEGRDAEKFFEGLGGIMRKYHDKGYFLPAASVEPFMETIGIILYPHLAKNKGKPVLRGLVDNLPNEPDAHKITGSVHHRAGQRFLGIAPILEALILNDNEYYMEAFLYGYFPYRDSYSHGKQGSRLLTVDSYGPVFAMLRQCYSRRKFRVGMKKLTSKAEEWKVALRKGDYFDKIMAGLDEIERHRYDERGGKPASAINWPHVGLALLGIKYLTPIVAGLFGFEMDGMSWPTALILWAIFSAIFGWLHERGHWKDTVGKGLKAEVKVSRWGIHVPGSSGWSGIRVSLFWSFVSLVFILIVPQLAIPVAIPALIVNAIFALSITDLTDLLKPKKTPRDILRKAREEEEEKEDDEEEDDDPEFARGVELSEEVKRLAEKLGGLSEPFAVLAKSELLPSDTREELAALTRAVQGLAGELTELANNFGNEITLNLIEDLEWFLKNRLAEMVEEASQLQDEINYELLPEHVSENDIFNGSLITFIAIKVGLDQLAERLNELLSGEAPARPEPGLAEFPVMGGTPEGGKGPVLPVSPEDDRTILDALEDAELEPWEVLEIENSLVSGIDYLQGYVLVRRNITDDEIQKYASKFLDKTKLRNTTHAGRLHARFVSLLEILSDFKRERDTNGMEFDFVGYHANTDTDGQFFVQIIVRIAGEAKFDESYSDRIAAQVCDEENGNVHVWTQGQNTHYPRGLDYRTNRQIIYNPLDGIAVGTLVMAEFELEPPGFDGEGSDDFDGDEGGPGDRLPYDVPDVGPQLVGGSAQFAGEAQGLLPQEDKRVAAAELPPSFEAKPRVEVLEPEATSPAFHIGLIGAPQDIIEELRKDPRIGGLAFDSLPLDNTEKENVKWLEEARRKSGAYASGLMEYHGNRAELRERISALIEILQKQDRENLILHPERLQLSTENIEKIRKSLHRLIDTELIISLYVSELSLYRLKFKRQDEQNRLVTENDNLYEDLEKNTQDAGTRYLFGMADHVADISSYARTYRESRDAYEAMPQHPRGSYPVRPVLMLTSKLVTEYGITGDEQLASMLKKEGVNDVFRVEDVFFERASIDEVLDPAHDVYLGDGTDMIARIVSLVQRQYAGEFQAQYPGKEIGPQNVAIGAIGDRLNLDRLNILDEMLLEDVLFVTMPEGEGLASQLYSMIVEIIASGNNIPRPLPQGTQSLVRPRSGLNVFIFRPIRPVNMDDYMQDIERYDDLSMAV
ncbi:MAG: hypothetical protein NG740_05485 [Omnitrophica bacterium]|nr:hypothetical protein [Candidatus Omnitrophota bacterium]